MIHSEQIFHMSCPNGSLVTVLLQKARSRFVATGTLLFHILRTTAHSRHVDAINTEKLNSQNV